MFRDGEGLPGFGGVPGAALLPRGIVNTSVCDLQTFLVSGKYLRQKRIDFQLPYDILWQWKHNQVQDKVTGLQRCLSEVLENSRILP